MCCVSRQSCSNTTAGGQAVRLAAIDARLKILEVIAASWGLAPDDLEVTDGMVRSRSEPRRQLSFPMAAELAVDSQGGESVVGVGEFRVEGVVIPDPETKYGNIACAYSFGAQVAEVEVDVETGKVRVLNFVAAHDVGRAINPNGRRGADRGWRCPGHWLRVV